MGSRTASRFPNRSVDSALGRAVAPRLFAAHALRPRVLRTAAPQCGSLLLHRNCAPVKCSGTSRCAPFRVAHDRPCCTGLLFSRGVLPPGGRFGLVGNALSYSTPRFFSKEGRVQFETLSVKHIPLQTKPASGVIGHDVTGPSLDMRPRQARWKQAFGRSMLPVKQKTIPKTGSIPHMAPPSPANPANPTPGFRAPRPQRLPGLCGDCAVQLLYRHALTFLFWAGGFSFALPFSD